MKEWIFSREDVEVLFRKNRRYIRQIKVYNSGILVIKTNMYKSYPFRTVQLKEWLQ